MYIYIAQCTENKTLFSTRSFIFASPNMGQLIRSTMFSFIAEHGEIIKMKLFITEDKQKYDIIPFDFVANTSLQKIDNTYSIQFTANDEYYCCPTLYIQEKNNK